MNYEIIKNIVFTISSIIGFYILYNDRIFYNIIYSDEFRLIPYYILTLL